MSKDLWKDSAAQVSMELIVVLAAVLAVALLAVSSLRDTAADAEKIGGKTAKKIMKELK
ncbi:MAG: hypothetical protein KAW41_06600 [Candidatus Diapherotrites archaeon]|nr:hypothetical protein [Candidatus Diapherotrites archaeon]